MKKQKEVYILIKLLVGMLSRLPKPVLFFFSDFLALLWYRIDKRHRNVVFSNIRASYPGRFTDRQARIFVRQNFKHIVSILFEVIWSSSKPASILFKHFEVRGAHHVHNAAEKGKGVVLLTCHMGNFELMVAGLERAGIEPYGLYRKLDFKPLERLLKEIRERFGTKMIPLRKASKTVQTLLNDGKIVGTLLDQNVDWYKGVFVDFFGRPACTNNGLAKLVLRTRSAVVPMFIRKENGRHILEFLPEIPLWVTNDPITDVEYNTQQFVSTIEKMVRQSPEQYFWVHNRWKTKPYCLINESNR